MAVLLKSSGPFTGQLSSPSNSTPRVQIKNLNLWFRINEKLNMASFNTPYGLCSVINSKSLIGVGDDDDGCAVITLGRNMVVRCRFSDQKQLNSWSTSISKLTSNVVYDSTSKYYVGVFDGIHVKKWTKSESSIEKLRKRTMKSEIHEILIDQKSNFSKPSLFLVFKNGSCTELESTADCKSENPGILLPDETIKTSKIISQEYKFLIIVVEHQKKYHLCYSVQLEEDNYKIIPDSVKRIKLRRPGVILLGHCIMEHDNENSLLTFWSDGFLYSLSLPLHQEKGDVGKFLGTIQSVSRNFEVAMVPVSYTQIAFYSSTSSEEGAILGIYNVKYGLFQVQTSFKLFNKPPQIWAVKNKIVILMGQRLVCVPFTLQAEVLSTLACSRVLHNKVPSLSQEVAAVIPTVKWEKTYQETSDQIEGPEKIKDLLTICASEGWSEYGISQFLFDKLLETKDYSSLIWCLDTFIDIPEDYIVKLLVLVLNEKNDVQINIGKVLGHNFIEKVVHKILLLPINSGYLLMGLRRNFKFEDCLTLLEHCLRISQENICGSNVLVWIIVLLDAFYQQLILSRDPNVSNLMFRLEDWMEDEIERMDNYKMLLPLLISVNNGTEIVNSQIYNIKYRIQKFRLYQ